MRGACSGFPDHWDDRRASSRTRNGPRRTCAKLPSHCLCDGLVCSLEQCKKTTRQYVLLGEAGPIIDNSSKASKCCPGGAWGASITGSGQPDIRFFLCPDGACRAPSESKSSLSL